MHNSRQCDEKLLQNSIALMKEMIEKKEVKKVNWVKTGDMLADVLTKKGGNSSWIKDVVSKGKKGGKRNKSNSELQLLCLSLYTLTIFHIVS